MRPPTPEDLRILAWQLGRPPRGVLAVRPCPYGFPQVILNRPLLPPHPHPLPRGGRGKDLGTPPPPGEEGAFPGREEKDTAPWGEVANQLPRSPARFGEGEGVKDSPLPQEGERAGVRGEPEPMPTIFWLSCPFLVEEVAKLESAGAVKRYERLLAEDPEFLRAYVQAHEAYRAERLALLSPEELAWIREKGYLGLLTTGIAGIQNPRRVKCLHAQLAHFLAGRENPVGARVAQELPRLFCPPERVRCTAV